MIIVEKPWLKNYQDGVPEFIDPDVYSSLPDMFDHLFVRYASAKAFYSFGTYLTYAQLDDESRRFAGVLQQTLKMQKGSRFAIMLPNILQYPVVLFAALRAGLIVVNVNPLYTPDELVNQLSNAGAEGIIVLEQFAHTVQEALPRLPQLKHCIVTKVSDCLPRLRAALMEFVIKYIYNKVPAWRIPHALSFKSLLDHAHADQFKPVALTSQDIAFLQYTGGTTGISKGAILTHRNLIANLQQADAWLRFSLSNHQEIVITALPLYHIFSLTANCFYFSSIGGLNVLIANPRDTKAMIREMSRFRFTIISGVNTLFNALLKHPDFKKLDFSPLKLALGGGMAVQRTVAEHWKAVTGKPLLEAYGLTETSPCVTLNPMTLQDYNGSIGLPVSSTDVTLLDDQGNPVPLGSPGELAIKGPQVMKGYWNHPDETAKVFTKDGWLLTGDMGFMDSEGYLYLLERKKDMILVSGFNVYPNEIEDVIASCKGVLEVAVIGVPDENAGEAVKACIVKENPSLTKEDILSYCKQHLTGYKQPKYVEFYPELPKTAVGKILRRALREDHRVESHA